MSWWVLNEFGSRNSYGFLFHTYYLFQKWQHYNVLCLTISRKLMDGCIALLCYSVWARSPDFLRRDYRFLPLDCRFFKINLTTIMHVINGMRKVEQLSSLLTCPSRPIFRNSNTRKPMHFWIFVCRYSPTCTVLSNIYGSKC